MSNSKNKKIRISYYISEPILSDVKDNMNKNGYDLKGKSRWISEAVKSLLALDNFMDLVNINDQMHGFEKLDSLSIEQTLKIEMDEAIINVRRKYPALEGVLSKILRTAIIQRLIN